MKRQIYVASSWRNNVQPVVVETLRDCGHEVYDFRHPREGGPDNPRALESGFHWSEIDPDWQRWTPGAYKHHLFASEVASNGFTGDWAAMNWADTCVLVLPSGRSGHIEAGYFVGARDKQLHILLQNDREGFEPELMYLMADGVHESMEAVIRALGVPRPDTRLATLYQAAFGGASA